MNTTVKGVSAQNTRAKAYLTQDHSLLIQGEFFRASEDMEEHTVSPQFPADLPSMSSRIKMEGGRYSFNKRVTAGYSILEASG